ncbi:GNAT family N-acetyltransferase [Deinococcus planocerae]|uniref:GNAT family N-acetyltransferase n=1 Tax=Deinococcus planocerae TaxID=1737569 RepID=UPI000C7F2EFF|nr:GNAT family N-acetyltransferase [Deinococcus planocerae]
MNVREATDADYPALADLQGTVWPDHGTTGDLLAHEDRELRDHPRGPHLWRVVVEEDGRVVGTASALQYPGMFHPDRYHVDLLVHPEAQGRGVGRALAGAMDAHLGERGARELLSGTQEDCPRGLAFLARQGFAEVMRFFDNVLELGEFDPSAWEDAARLPAPYRQATLAEVIAEVGEEPAWHAYFDAVVEIREDVPRTGEATPIVFEHFRKRGDDPRFLPQGVFFALTPGGEVAAMTELYTDAVDPAKLHTGLTGARRAHRRKGLALALKLAALGVARERGAASVWTGNATTNAPMLALNTRLGFRPRPAWIEMRRGTVEDA